MFSFFLCIHLGVELMGPAVTSISALQRHLDCHPQWLLQFTLPSAVKIPVSPYFSYLTCFILVGINRYFIVICVVIFLIVNDSSWTSFNVSLDFFAYLLKTFLFRSFDYFNQFNFLYHWKFLLFFLDTKPLSDIRFMNIFFLYVNCLRLLYCIPCPEIIHKFQQSPIYLFFLCCFCLGIRFKKPCSNPMLWKFMLMSLKCFIVLVLILRYLIYSVKFRMWGYNCQHQKKFNTKHGETWRIDEKTIYRKGDGVRTTWVMCLHAIFSLIKF